MNMLRSCQFSQFRLKELISIKHGFAFKGEFFSDQGPFVVLTPGNFFEERGFRSKGERRSAMWESFPKVIS